MLQEAGKNDAKVALGISVETEENEEKESDEWATIMWLEDIKKRTS